jgi:hypothetical protein
MFWRIGDGRFAFFYRARGLKPCSPQKAYAALNGRSSTVVYALVVAGVAVVGRRRWCGGTALRWYDVAGGKKILSGQRIERQSFELVP